MATTPDPYNSNDAKNAPAPIGLSASNFGQMLRNVATSLTPDPSNADAMRRRVGASPFWNNTAQTLGQIDAGAAARASTAGGMHTEATPQMRSVSVPGDIPAAPAAAAPAAAAAPSTLPVVAPVTAATNAQITSPETQLPGMQRLNPGVHRFNDVGVPGVYAGVQSNGVRTFTNIMGPDGQPRFAAGNDPTAVAKPGNTYSNAGANSLGWGEPGQMNAATGSNNPAPTMVPQSTDAQAILNARAGGTTATVGSGHNMQQVAADPNANMTFASNSGTPVDQTMLASISSPYQAMMAKYALAKAIDEDPLKDNPQRRMANQIAMQRLQGLEGDMTGGRGDAAAMAAGAGGMGMGRASAGGAGGMAGPLGLIKTQAEIEKDRQDAASGAERAAADTSKAGTAAAAQAASANLGQQGQTEKDIQDRIAVLQKDPAMQALAKQGLPYQTIAMLQYFKEHPDPGSQVAINLRAALGPLFQDAEQGARPLTRRVAPGFFNRPFPGVPDPTKPLPFKITYGFNGDPIFQNINNGNFIRPMGSELLNPSSWFDTNHSASTLGALLSNAETGPALRMLLAQEDQAAARRQQTGQ